MRWAIAAAIVALTASGAAAGEGRPLKIEKRSVPRPAGRVVVAPFPRSLFLVQITQRNQLWDPGERTVYFLLDPSRPAAGFRKVYEGPGEQHCRFLTPLFGGAGVAMGEVDPERRKSERRLFWFDLLGGKPGETIALRPWNEWQAGSELRFRSAGGLHRLDPIAGALRSYPIDLTLEVHIDEDSLLGVSPLEGRLHAVLVDVARETIADLGELPGALQFPGDSNRLFPVGPAARDGLGFVSGGFDGFDLWYRPPDSRWLRVLRDVHILKNFGGEPPWLPVAYLGERRFAAGRTVKDEAPGGEEDQGAPGSLGVTMLVEGMTGRIVKETKPITYHGNPDLEIPEGWWSREAAEARRRKAGESPQAPGTFRWDEKEDAWRATGGRAVRPGEKEDASVSADGRWLAVYSHWAQEGPPARINFRILAGNTTEERTFEILLPSREGCVSNAAWQLLTSPAPDPAELDTFRPARRDPFLDPR